MSHRTHVLRGRSNWSHAVHDSLRGGELKINSIVGHPCFFIHMYFSFFYEFYIPIITVMFITLSPFFFLLFIFVYLLMYLVIRLFCPI